jgi:hypothetical protein
MKLRNRNRSMVYVEAQTQAQSNIHLKTFKSVTATGTYLPRLEILYQLLSRENNKKSHKSFTLRPVHRT